MLPCILLVVHIQLKALFTEVTAYHSYEEFLDINTGRLSTPNMSTTAILNGVRSFLSFIFIGGH